MGDLGLASQFKITTKAEGQFKVTMEALERRPGTGKREVILSSIEKSLEELKTDKVC